MPSLETGNWKLETGNWELGTGNWELETGNYSYLNASIGSRRDALIAGKSPKKIPTLAENPMPIANDHQGSETGKPDAQCTRRPMELPKMMPSTPPADVKKAASIRHSHRIPRGGRTLAW